MIIDCHAYWDERNMSLEELNRRAKAHGVSGTVLSPPCTLGFEPNKSPFMYGVQRFLLRRKRFRSLAEKVSHSFYTPGGELRPLWKLYTDNNKPIVKVLRPDNSQLLQAISPFEDFYAWYWLNPIAMPEKSLLEKELRNPKIVGIKLHAYWHRFEDCDVFPVIDLASKKGLPVYFILGFRWIGWIETLLKGFPQSKFIFGYGGFPYFDELWIKILPYPNAVIDLTSFHLDEKFIREAVRTLGAKRCLYGSDCPYNFKNEQGEFDYNQTFQRVSNLGLSEEEVDLILGRNAAQLLRLSRVNRIT